MTAMPSLSWPVTIAVLFAALLHAAWNVSVKGSKDPAADLAGLTFGASLLTLPIVLWVPFPKMEVWPYLLASNVIHIAYYSSLAATYRYADISVGYPIMRGSAPLLVTLFGILALREHPSASTWLGVLLISGGVLSLAFVQGKQTGSWRGAGFALANATTIATYTLVDAAGARMNDQTLSYVAWMFFLEGVPFAAFMYWRRGSEFLQHLRSRWHIGLAAGFSSALAYGIAVWAMTRAPVGAVAALRETSVVFAMLLASALLNDRLSLRRWCGVVAVFVGAVVLRV